MPDRYAGFAELAMEKKEGVDYRICMSPRESDVLILTPHGGKIESGTSEITNAGAGDSYTAYCFEGCQPSRNYVDLHITSGNFDEPRALGAVDRARFVVAIHGYRDRERAFVMVGGLDQKLRKAIEISLTDAGFMVEPPTAGARGCSPDNICNRGPGGRGCQLEISRRLRDRLKESAPDLLRFASAIRDAISLVAPRRNEDQG